MTARTYFSMPGDMRRVLDTLLERESAFHRRHSLFFWERRFEGPDAIGVTYYLSRSDSGSPCTSVTIDHGTNIPLSCGFTRAIQEVLDSVYRAQLLTPQQPTK